MGSLQRLEPSGVGTPEYFTQQRQFRPHHLDEREHAADAIRAEVRFLGQTGWAIASAFRTRNIMRNFLLAIALCLPLGAAFAQTAGSITGEVKDPSGAVTPNAAVTVTNSETNVARSTVTNAAG